MRRGKASLGSAHAAPRSPPATRRLPATLFSYSFPFPFRDLFALSFLFSPLNFCCVSSLFSLLFPHALLLKLNFLFLFLFLSLPDFHSFFFFLYFCRCLIFIRYSQPVPSFPFINFFFPSRPPFLSFISLFLFLLLSVSPYHSYFHQARFSLVISSLSLHFSSSILVLPFFLFTFLFSLFLPLFLPLQRYLSHFSSFLGFLSHLFLFLFF